MFVGAESPPPAMFQAHVLMERYMNAGMYYREAAVKVMAYQENMAGGFARTPCPAASSLSTPPLFSTPVFIVLKAAG